MLIFIVLTFFIGASSSSMEEPSHESPVIKGVNHKIRISDHSKKKFHHRNEFWTIPVARRGQMWIRSEERTAEPVKINR